MTYSRRDFEVGGVVRIDSVQQSATGKPGGLTEEERQILLAELAEITAELDALQGQAREIAGRVHRARSTSAGREMGAA